MASNKPQLKTYTEQWIKDKFTYISNFERRSDSKQLEYVVLKYIRDFEAEYGEIKTEEDKN